MRRGLRNGLKENREDARERERHCPLTGGPQKEREESLRGRAKERKTMSIDMRALRIVKCREAFETAPRTIERARAREKETLAIDTMAPMWRSLQNKLKKNREGAREKERHCPLTTRAPRNRQMRRSLRNVPNSYVL